MEIKAFLRGLGRNIAFRRRTLKLTQEQLAERVGTSTEWISQVERGIGRPSVEMLVQVAATLDASVQEIIGQADENACRRDDVLDLLVRAERLPSRAVRVLVATATAMESEYGEPVGAVAKPPGGEATES